MKEPPKMKVDADAMLSFAYGLTAMLTISCVWALPQAIGRYAVKINIAKKRHWLISGISD